MTTIWSILALMTGAAVLAMLWPLSRRAASPRAASAAGAVTQTHFYEDQLAEIERDLARGLIAPSEAEAARTEAARRLLRAAREEPTETGSSEPIAEPRLRQRRAASAFALSTIPLVALLVYGHYGSPNLPAQTEADRQAAASGGRELMTAIGQVEARLATDPNEARGWAVIAPVYMRLGRYADAARAYENLVRLKGADADRLAAWGEALVANEDGRVSAEARAVFERAATLDPKHPKTQFYLARADELAGNAEAAGKRLRDLAEQSPADAPWMGLVNAAIGRLKATGEFSNEPATPPAAPSPERKSETQTKPAAPPMSEPSVATSGANTADAAPPASTTPTEAKPALSHTATPAPAPAQAPSPTVAAPPLGSAQPEAPKTEPSKTEPEAPAAMRSDAPERDAPPESAAGPVATGATADALRAMPPGERGAAIRAMVEGLDRRLVAKGGTSADWMKLVRSYAALGDRAEAAKALSRARMALAANPGAAKRLDILARELGLRTAAFEP